MSSLYSKTQKPYQSRKYYIIREKFHLRVVSQSHTCMKFPLTVLINITSVISCRFLLISEFTDDVIQVNLITAVEFIVAQ